MLNSDITLIGFAAGHFCRETTMDNNHLQACQGTDVNRTLPCLLRGSLEIMLTVPFRRIKLLKIFFFIIFDCNKPE